MLLNPYRFADAGAAFVPDDLTNLFALYDADRVSDQTLVEESDATTIADTDTMASGHAWVWATPSSDINARVETDVADGVVEAEVDRGMGVAFRASGADDGLYVELDGSGNLDLSKLASGTPTSLTTASPGAAAGSVLRVSFHNDQVKVWVNPVDPATEDPDIDYTMTGGDYTTYGGNTLCGFYLHDGSEAQCGTFTVSSLDQTADATVAYDSFTRADSTSLGSTEVGGLAWTEQAGGWEITSNKLEHTGGSGTNHFVDVDTGVADMVVSLDCTNAGAGNAAGVAFRSDGTDTLYAMLDSNSDVSLRKFETSSVSVIATSSPGVTSGTVTVYAITDRILVFVDGTLEIDHTLSSGDQTTFGSLTRAGAWGGGNSGDTYDNFRVRRLTTLPVWPDVSRTGTDRVNANHAVQTDETKQPVVVEDWHEAGVDTVLFDGTDDVLSSGNFADGSQSQPNSVFAVAEYETSSLGSNSTIFNGDTPGDYHALRINSGEFRIYADSYLSSGVAEDADIHFWATTFDGGSSSVEIDGTGATGAAGADPLGEATIGAINPSGADRMVGSISAVAIENAATTEDADMLAWSQDKYSTP